MLSEICFTLYSDAADRYNFLGHIYKAVAYCYIYRAMFVSSVREPFERLLRITADLRDSEARFSTVFHFSPIGIGLGTLDGSMLVANQAWLDLLGYQLDEVVGRTTEGLGIYLRPEDRLEVIATLKACGRVGNLELPFRRKNGDQIVAQYSAEIIRLSGEPLLMVMVTDVTARKAEAVALTRYREIVEQHGDPLVFFDHDERIVIANRAYVTLIGKSTADLQGRTLDQVVGVSYYQAADLRLKAALAGEAQHYPLERFFPDGRRHVCDIRLAPFVVDGKVQGVVANLHDITELREIQETLEAAQAMADVASWSLDVASGVYATSAAGRKQLAWETTDISEESIQALIHPKDLPRRQAAWRAALAGAPFDIEHRMVVDGRTFQVHVKAQVEFDADGRPVRAFGMTQDVTAAREAQQALEAYRDRLEDLVAARTAAQASAEAKMRLIVDTIGDGLFGVDLESRITFINPAACTLLGAGAEQLLGTDYHRVLADGPGGAPSPVETTIRTGLGTRSEDAVFRNVEGRPLPVRYSTQPMSQDGTVIGAVVSFADISDRKRSEAARESALAEAERLAQVRREFLANMSHEIRTPLTSVLGLAEVGRRQSVGRKSGDIFGGILNAGQTLLGVVDDILDFSKIEAGKFTLERRPLVLGEVIDRAIELVAVKAYTKGLEMRVEEGLELPAVCLGDSLRLTRVLGNLLSNAVKFTGGGGSVVLAAGRAGDWLVFEVTDSGVGMAAEQVARLFRPFEQADGSTTRHFGGTGLGLAITKDLVELMGGSILATSRLGEGSRFTVRLPLEAVGALEPPAVPASVALAGMTQAEALPLLTALPRLGARVALLAPGQPVPSTAGLAVTTAEIAAEPSGRAAVDSALAQGQRVVLVTTPGSGGIPAELANRVQVVERPLRLRHVLAAPQPMAETASMAGKRLEGLRILVAEDNDVNRLVLEDLLALEGARPDSVANGWLAVERLGERGCGSYDVVVSDIQMPEMDGYELAKRIAALDPGLPVIGLTAHAMPEERMRCLAAGMVEHITKPVDIDQLVATVLRHARHAPIDGIAPLVDRRQLEGRYGERKAFIAKLLATVRTAHAGTAADLRIAIDAQDMPRLALLAHAIKGTAGNLMSAALQDLAQRTEAAARTRRGEATALAGQLATAIDTLLAELTVVPS